MFRISNDDFAVQEEKSWHSKDISHLKFYNTLCCKVVQYLPGAAMSTRTVRVNSKRFIFTASYLCRS